MTQILIEPPATTTSPRFIINRDPLLAAVEAASAVVSERPVKPVLGGLLIEATTDSITIFGTNLEIGVSAECGEVQVERTGAMVLPAIKLRELLKLEDSATVTIDCGADIASITSDSNHGKLQTLKVSEFPPTKRNHLNADGWVKAKTEDLRRALRRVLPFVGDLSRFAWQGILLDYADGEMATVCCL